MAEPGIFEILYSTRAMRRLKPDPIPEATLKKIVDAGIRAPSGGNVQEWAFLLVRDPELKPSFAMPIGRRGSKSAHKQHFP